MRSPECPCWPRSAALVAALVVGAAAAVAGLAVGSFYHRLGQSVEGGNNLLIDEIHDPQRVVPRRMAPSILITTTITHLFGGSAGREGTAVQMAGALADHVAQLFKLGKEERRILLMSGISAGFASVFGTPLAGAVFGLARQAYLTEVVPAGQRARQHRLKG